MKALFLGDQIVLDSMLKDSISNIEKWVSFDYQNFKELKTLDANTLTDKLQEYDILVGGWGAVSLPADYSPKKAQLYCNVTGNFGGRVEAYHIDRGLRLSNWGEVISHTIAESALMMILSSLKNVGIIYDRMHHEKIWRSSNLESRSLFRRKVGFLGFGLIAQELAKLLKPFHCQLQAYDPYIPREVLEEYQCASIESLDELFCSSDILTIHAAKTEETNLLVDDRRLSLMNDSAVLVNTARGNCLDEAALAAHHQKGRLYSALDVYQVEPLPSDSPLRDQARCLLFPHQAGPTLDQYYLLGERACENIRRFTKGEPLIMEITKEKFQRMT